MKQFLPNNMIKAVIKADMSRKSTATSGMTILEVLAVVVIIGILGAMAAPGWLAFVNRQRASRAQDQILQALKQTQSEARRTRQNRTLTLVFNDGGMPQIDLDSRPGTDPATGADLFPPEAGLPPTDLGEGDLEPNMISLRVFEDDTAITDDVFRITFAPNGGLDVDEQNLDLPVTIAVASPANSGAQRCIILETLLGATRIEQNDECTPN